MSSNKGITYAFRNEVLLYLNGKGLDVNRPPELKSIGQFIDDPFYGDVLGLDPWVLETHSRKTYDMSGDLDAAAREARQAGTDLYATVIDRRGRSIEQSYVVMPLQVFTRVLRRERQQARHEPR